MAKGGYFVIGYPDEHDGRPFCVPSDVEKAIQDSGGEMCWILHDRDEIKPHYHILCMWAKSPMLWDDFVQLMKDYHMKCPDRKHRGRTPDENRYCRREAVVRNVDRCLAYMLHPEDYE